MPINYNLSLREGQPPNKVTSLDCLSYIYI